MRIRDQEFFDRGSGMEKFGSGMEQFGLGIRDKHTGSATLSTVSTLKLSIN
jgi:hypothetical protein